MGGGAPLLQYINEHLFQRSDRWTSVDMAETPVWTGNDDDYVLHSVDDTGYNNYNIAYTTQNG